MNKLLKLISISLFILKLITIEAYASEIKSNSDTTIKVKVTGLTCGEDLKTIAENIKKINGVMDCKPIKLGHKSVFKVIFNPTLVSTEAIIKAIENTAGCENPNDRPYKVKRR